MRGTIGGDRLHQPDGHRLVAVEHVVGLDPERVSGRLGGHVRVAVAIAADPAAPMRGTPARAAAASVRSAPESSGRSRPAGRPDRGPAAAPPRRAGRGRRRAARYSRGATVNSDSSKKVIAVRTSSSGVGRDRTEIGGPPQQADLLAQPTSDVAVLVGRQARVVEPLEQPVAAPQRDQQRPSAGLGRVGRQDRRDRQPPDQRDDVVHAAPGPPDPADGLGHRVVEDPASGRPLAASERADPMPLLGQVGQLEVQPERADERLGRGQVERVELGRRAWPARPGRSAPAERDRPRAGRARRARADRRPPARR